MNLHSMKRKRKKTPDDLKRHFSVRCIQRVGFPIDEEELKRRMVRHALSFLWKESNTKSHFLVPKDMLPVSCMREIEAVYDSKLHEFVTVLFRDGIEFAELAEGGCHVAV